MRSVGRVLRKWPGGNDVRLHHFLPGIVIAFGAGAASILASADGIQPWVSAPFGAGVALTSDELRLLAAGTTRTGAAGGSRSPSAASGRSRRWVWGASSPAVAGAKLSGTPDPAIDSPGHRPADGVV